MEKRTKILFISHTNFLGGAELCFIEMLKALCSKQAYEIYAVFPAHEGQLKKLCAPFCKQQYTQYLPAWIDEGVKYPVKKKINRFVQIISSVKKSIKLIKAINPDMVITNTSVIPQFLIASKFTKTKQICYIHELVDEDHGCSFIFGKALSKKIISWCSDVVLTNSKFVNSRYLSIVKESRLKMLYQPAELSITNIDPERKGNNPVLTLLIIGKVSRTKGQKEAILACKHLKSKGIQFKLLIVGIQPSPYTDELKNLVAPDLKDEVEFIPFTKDPYIYYQQADIVLVCSRCEALGRITIEAMKMGLPVVASDRGGNLELIEPNDNGLFYQLGNPDDLANKIMQLQDKKLREQLGKNGKNWANSRFNMDKFSNDLDGIIKTTVKTVYA